MSPTVTKTHSYTLRKSSTTIWQSALRVCVNTIRVAELTAFQTCSFSSSGSGFAAAEAAAEAAALARVAAVAAVAAVVDW